MISSIGISLGGYLVLFSSKPILYNVGPPKVISWFRFAPVTIVRNTINHIVIGLINQLNAILGASHYTNGLLCCKLLCYAKVPRRSRRIRSPAEICYGRVFFNMARLKATYQALTNDTWLVVYLPL